MLVNQFWYISEFWMGLICGGVIVQVWIRGGVGR